MKKTDQLLMHVLCGLHIAGNEIREGRRSARIPRDVRHVGKRAYSFAHEGVKYEPGVWLDRELSERERREFSRAVREAEQLRLAIAIRPNGRCTALQLTPTGLQRALKIVGQQADRAAILPALNATSWASDEMKAVLAQPT